MPNKPGSAGTAQAKSSLSPLAIGSALATAAQTSQSEAFCGSYVTSPSKGFCSLWGEFTIPNLGTDGSWAVFAASGPDTHQDSDYLVFGVSVEKQAGASTIARGFCQNGSQTPVILDEFPLEPGDSVLLHATRHKTDKVQAIIGRLTTMKGYAYSFDVAPGLLDQFCEACWMMGCTSTEYACFGDFDFFESRVCFGSEEQSIGAGTGKMISVDPSRTGEFRFSARALGDAGVVCSTSNSNQADLRRERALGAFSLKS